MVLGTIGRTVSSVEIPLNNLSGIIGPNGSGISTLTNCLPGLLILSSGEIRLGGKAQAAYKAKEIARIIGYVPPYSHTQHMAKACAALLIWGGLLIWERWKPRQR